MIAARNGTTFGWWALMLAFSCGCFGSCSRLSGPPSGESAGPVALPAPRMAPDSVALEIAVATLDGDRLETFNRMWNKADVQVLPLETRKQLDRNGFRVGVLGSQLPGELTSALSWTRPLLTANGEILASSHTPLLEFENTGTFLIKQIEQLKIGEEHWVPCSQVQQQIAWKVDSVDEQRSGVCQLALCGFMISHVPIGDNSINLWLRPMIRHGQHKLRYGVGEDTLLIREQQKRLSLTELNFVHRLRLGQTLVVTNTGAQEDMGQLFFAAGRYSAARQVLLIRPVLMGQDDLFAPERTTRRLSTSLD